MFVYVKILFPGHSLAILANVNSVEFIRHDLAEMKVRGEEAKARVALYPTRELSG